MLLVPLVVSGGRASHHKINLVFKHQLVFFFVLLLAFFATGHSSRTGGLLFFPKLLFRLLTLFFNVAARQQSLIFLSLGALFLLILIRQPVEAIIFVFIICTSRVPPLGHLENFSPQTDALSLLFG